MKRLFAASTALMASAQLAWAVDPCPPGAECTPVPEISALEGTAALAVVAALVLLAWERRRRAS
jgi:hypothetical protein